MVQRICPACQYGNPLDDKFCGQCGAALERLLPVRQESTALTIAGRQIPAHWQQIGKAAAIGAAALAAEVGLAWLQRKMEGGSASTALTNTRRNAQIARTAAKVTTIVSQRVIELIDNGSGAVKITDNHTWRRIDE